MVWLIAYSSDYYILINESVWKKCMKFLCKKCMPIRFVNYTQSREVEKEKSLLNTGTKRHPMKFIAGRFWDRQNEVFLHAAHTYKIYYHKIRWSSCLDGFKGILKLHGKEGTCHKSYTLPTDSEAACLWIIRIPPFPRSQGVWVSSWSLCCSLVS